MGRASDAREVLIAEALGDFVELLDRIEAVTPTLEDSCRRLEVAADRLLTNIEPFQRRIVQRAFEAHNEATAHIVEQANLVMRKSALEQVGAMQESARRIFNDEVGPRLNRVADQLRKANLRERPWWQDWLTHTAAALSAAGFTCALMMHLASAKADEPRQATSAPSLPCAAPPQPPTKGRDRR